MQYNENSSNQFIEGNNNQEDFYLNTNFDTQIKSSKFNCTLNQIQEEMKKNEFVKSDLANEKLTKSKSYKNYALNELDQSEFDQFEVNQKLFKTNSTYNDKVYNPEVKYDNIPENLKNLAEKIEKEIKSKKSHNNHVNEERGLSNNLSDSEEAKYSSVIRANNAKQQDMANKSKVKSFFKNIIIILVIVFIIFISYRVNKIYRRSSVDMKRPYEFATLNSYSDDITVN
jgi:PAB1-binding protein PBP1